MTITLFREPPAEVNEGEIVVGSNEELPAARLSGCALKVRFAPDSALEGDGFEPSVPRRE